MRDPQELHPIISCYFLISGGGDVKEDFCCGASNGFKKERSHNSLKTIIIQILFSMSVQHKLVMKVAMTNVIV